MHFCLLFLVLGALFNFGHARAVASDPEPRQLGLGDVPACGLDCMVLGIPGSQCAVGDFDCMCVDTELITRVGSCMITNCTMQEGLDTARVQASLCNFPHTSQRKKLLNTSIMVYVVCFFCVLGRTAGKVVSKRVGLDDYINVSTWLLAQFPAACTLLMILRGFGDHIWDLQDGDLMAILKLFYCTAAVYGVVLGLIKVCLVLSYLQIFVDRSFRIIAYITMAGIITSTLIIFFLSVFLCSPIEFFWNRDIKGKCISPRDVSYANSASAIVQDLVLLALPLVYVRNLNVSRWRKYAVGFMFAAGTFGCITTMIRIHTLYGYNISFDPTWDYAPLVFWTILELTVCSICLSLPAIRILVTRMLPTRFKDLLSRAVHSTGKSNKSNNSGPYLQSPATPQQAGSQKEWYKPLGRAWLSIDDHKDDYELDTVDLPPLAKAELKRDSKAPPLDDYKKPNLAEISAIGCLSDRSYSEEFIQTENGLESTTKQRPFEP